MKLGYYCNPGVSSNNNHKECSGKFIENPNTENEETFDCECWCHKTITTDEYLQATGKTPRWFFGS